MISQTAEYALRAVVYLAENKSGARTIQQIASGSQSPAGYLAKVMKDLAREGVVVSQRGPGGGFVLSREPADITLYDIVNAVDPIVRITQCPLGRPEHESKLCILHERLDEAARLVEESFRATTVADVIRSPVFGEQSAGRLTGG